VLGDVVGPAARDLHLSAGWSRELAQVTGESVTSAAMTDRSVMDAAVRPVADGIVVLHKVHRYGGGIAALAEAVQRGDADGAIAVLREERDDVRWIEADLADRSALAQLDGVRSDVVSAARTVVEAAGAGDARAALAALGGMRVLCAHRRGPYGVATWTPTIERWLTEAVEGYGAGGRWYVGRPLLVTANDYGLQLYNGDTGVIVDDRPGGEEPRVRAVFERRGDLLAVSPTRLGAAETVHAMTIHKSQGSQFGRVAVLLPDARSPVLSRELLYTAATRARHHLTIAGDEEAVRTAITSPIARASGLGEALWGPGSGG
jgi:exodeoxyribonuclease V alpha subunit